ncbi:MAG: tRNA (adenosine(37)-N6)-threonylcarbamoyltransferase complex ATPase subunit type 1 TsaE [Flavobacteriaceae bacterium]|nr:tRNA (adenosine(37)-N6)-threonylcarbamoyltransferase complex ATPase subunit type 1 TsaE [Flavobacteriaceae bacterium]
MQISYSLSDLESVAQSIKNELRHPIVALHGGLGMGKTTLVKSLIASLGSTDVISSPTFGLVHQYNTPNGPVFHMDLYRLEDAAELQNLGIDEYLYSGRPCFIEWPELLLDQIERISHHIRIFQIDEHHRKLEFS